MLYLYHKDASSSQITLVGDEHRYIFKVRRHKLEDTLYLRNLEDALLHTYIITHIDKHSVIMELKESIALNVEAKKVLHIAWCIIDPKNVEKVLPSLNELGVDKITFIYCQRSQKSFSLDFKRLKKILLNSSQQSGRSQMMTLEMSDSLEMFLKENPQAKILHFSDNKLKEKTDIDTIVIGCEGGFSKEEIDLFDSNNTIGLDTPLVLKSESAICAVASKILL
ncbi:MAG: 16S rRNA (uracil(1498)-N(3))-methyltransferase [Epsilonproteobacteria bacterium]|nr:MAG: 16S rRNA (uracil(1498)-N(3))-methyltransferase [Campylobacterota bacterium]